MTLVRKTLAELISCARASTGLIRSADGIWSSVGNDLTRVSFERGRSVILSEVARTNILLNSNAITSWGATRTTVAAAAVYGAANSFSLTANQTNVNGGFVSDLAIGGSMAAGTYVMSVRVLKNTGWMALRPVLVSNFGDAVTAWFDADAGTFGTVLASGGSSVVTTPSALSVIDEGAFWVVRLRFAVTSTATIRLAIYVVDTNSSLMVTSGRATTIMLPQCELGSFDTSPIITAGAAVTRQADQLSLQTGLLAAAIGGPFSVLEIWRARHSSGGAELSTVWDMDDAATDRVTSYINESTGQHHVNAFAAGVNQFTVTGAAYTSDNAWKVASRFEGGAYARSINGAAVLERMGAILPDGLTLLGIGRQPNGATPVGRLELDQFIVYPAGLENAELEALSA